MPYAEAITIAGDISPTRRYETNFVAGELIDNEIHTLIKNSYSIANLESPLTSSSNTIKKTGPSLKGAPSCAQVIAKLGINAVTIANNHIMDFGISGLSDTISSCQESSIATFGAGPSIATASEPHVVHINNRRLLFFGLAENEFSIATGNSAGAFPADPISFMDLMQSYKVEGDLVIVLLHMGKAMYSLPTPKLQTLCRFMVRNGADVIVCQHSHCIAAYERYKTGLIFYGQGNFIFDGVSSASESWYTGYLIKLTLNSHNIFDFKLFPFRQVKEKPYVQMITGKEKQNMLNSLSSLEESLDDKEFLKTSWDSFIASERDYYLSILAGHNRFLRVANRYIHFLNARYSDTAYRYLLNIIRSETHREGLLSLLDKQQNTLF